MKKFLLGTIFGLTLAISSVTVSAKVQEYVLTKYENPIVVNGNKYSDTTNPVLSYNGTTYVPLRNFTTMVGATTQYDKTNSTININTSGSSKLNTAQNETVYETTADGLQLTTVEGTVYVLERSIPTDLYGVGRGSDGVSVNYGNTKTNEIILYNIPYKVIDARTHIEYNYYIQNIKPLIES